MVFISQSFFALSFIFTSFMYASVGELASVSYSCLAGFIQALYISPFIITQYAKWGNNNNNCYYYYYPTDKRYVTLSRS